MRFFTCGNDNKIHIYVGQVNNINFFFEEFFQKDFNYESSCKSVCFLNYV